MFHAALWRHIQTREDFEGVTMCSSMLEASISGYVERERELATLGNVMGMYQIFRTVIHRITSRGYLIPPLSRLPPLLPPLPLPPPTALRRPDVAKLLILYPVGNGRYWSYSKGRSLGCGNTAGHLQWKQRVCLRVFAGQLRLQQRWVDRKSEGREDIRPIFHSKFDSKMLFLDADLIIIQISIEGMIRCDMRLSDL